MKGALGMKKKVLVVGSSLKDKGGIVTVIKNISKSDIITKKFDLIMIETYISSTILLKIFYFITAFVKVIYSLVFRHPCLIHIHMSHKGSFYRASLIVLIAKLFKKPIIIHAHGSSFKDFYYAMNGIQKKYCNFIFKQINLLIVLSREWGKFFSTIVDTEKIKILYNGVYPVNEINIKRDEKPVCLFLGRIGQRKGTYDLITCFGELKREYPSLFLKMILAGDGELATAQKLIAHNDLDREIKVVGWVNEIERNHLLLDSDILILPSYNEGLPMAILEAMNYGLSVISSNVGGIPEAIINERTGYMIDPGDIKQLAIYLKKTIEDAQLRKKFSINERKMIFNKFNNTKLMKNLETIYEDLT